MRKDAALFAGAAVFAAILAVMFWIQLRQSNQLTAELRQQVEELKAAGNAVPMRPAAGSMASQSATTPAAMPVPPATQSVAGSTSVLAYAPGTASAPNCEALLAQLKQSSSAATAGLAAELKLAPTETQRFTELRAEQMTASLPCGGPAGGPPSSPEQLNAQLQALLGPARFEQLQEINAVRSTTQNMTILGSQLAQSGAPPLDEEQSRQLTATILEENRRSRHAASWPVAPSDPQGRLAYEEENLKLTEERFERTLKAAQSYLRPEQLAQLRGNMTRQIESMRAIVKNIRTSVEAGQGIPTPQPVVILNAPARGSP